MPAPLQSLRQYLKVVDAVLEVADARLPVSSRYPDLEKLIGFRARVVVLTRADLADPAATACWLEKLRAGGTRAVAMNARTGAGDRLLYQYLKAIAKAKREARARRGLGEAPLRVMALGIPNVGKSSVLNRLAGRGAARTGNRPGITRGPQWIRIKDNLELLDTPGVLWPRWREPRTALWLGALGCAPEESVPVVGIACLVGEFLLREAPGTLAARYGIQEQGDATDILAAIGRARGFLLPGGVVDQEKTARALVNDFREGRLGRFTLERP
ncbi:ribosome biogenesis GTPase YlqF [Neomoorella thermoacetica]|uniref:ribosome biogenesis GTPase YlqF n=1 Tax=Neomoorella thermoacetica TaxID=1525 RepID=UPI0008FB02A1|nr:ribosome biogenesis GTPase YlqF [Moorella thermoacetica]APC08091.1 ribosome biogenesis GTPase A [Moorella thermoacetica]